MYKIFRNIFLHDKKRNINSESLRPFWLKKNVPLYSCLKLPGRTSLSGWIFFQWAKVTLKGHVIFQNKKNTDIKMVISRLEILVYLYNEFKLVVRLELKISLSPDLPLMAQPYSNFRSRYRTIHLRRWQIFKIFDPYPLPVGSFLLLSVGKFDKFLTPPALKNADVLNGWFL